MAFLLDTCAVSELRARHPDPKAVESLLAIERSEIYFSVISIAEIKNGIELIENPGKKAEYERWLNESILAVFIDHILPVDLEVAMRWGVMVAMLELKGFRMQVKDAFIAATALEHGLTLVTRNVADFAHSGVSLYNPWE
jgi:predicted nucleic acid-binding protein